MTNVVGERRIVISQLITYSIHISTLYLQLVLVEFGLLPGTGRTLIGALPAGKWQRREHVAWRFFLLT